MTDNKAGLFRDYRDYATDQQWAALYSDYQQRYRHEPRFSDLESAKLVSRALHQMGLNRPARVLDIGCSTGNFLRILKRDIEEIELFGGDLMESAIAECAADASLSDIQFEIMDILSLPRQQYDVIVANAVTYFFEQDEYRRALAQMAAALVPGGYLISFEFVYPDEREQRVVEISEGHPMGLKFWLRSRDTVVSALQQAGFTWFDFIPFNVPVDLPVGEVDGPDPHLRTRTVRNPLTGFREQYRGDLYQPWVHIFARRQCS